MYRNPKNRKTERKRERERASERTVIKMKQICTSRAVHLNECISKMLQNCCLYGIIVRRNKLFIFADTFQTSLHAIFDSKSSVLRALGFYIYLRCTEQFVRITN